jgi:transposase
MAGMEVWAPQERTPGPRGRHLEVMNETRLLVQRLAAAAERKFSQGENEMGMHRKVDADAIRADHLAGMSISAIATKHGCVRSTVGHYLNAKEPADGGEGGNGEMDAAKVGIDADKIRELHGEGKSNREVARTLAVSTSTVFRYLKNGKANGCGGTESTGNSRHAQARNGGRKAPAEAQLAALEVLADAEWQRLPVVERVRLLLARGPVGGR